MSTPSVNRTYHVIAFDGASQAAAFVAALSRFLTSPHGEVYMVQPDIVEVWSQAPATGDVVEVYLSDGALMAATAAFAPVSVAGTRRGELLPTGCALMIGGHGTSAWGVADVQRHFTPR